MLMHLAAGWYWIRIKQDMAEYVAHCEMCLRNKHSALSPSGLLQPLSMLDQIREDLSMDFIEGFPLSGAYDTILVVVD